MIVRSTLPDLSLPTGDFSTIALERARRLPRKTALVDADTGASITYGQVTFAVDTAARRLNAGGVRRGQVTAICEVSTPAFVVAAHAVWRAGGIVMPVSPLLATHELRQHLADAGVRNLIVASDEADIDPSPSTADRALDAARQCGVEAVFQVDECGEVIPRAIMAPDRQPSPRPAGVTDDTALIRYSSGTTGAPKAVMQSHQSLIAALLQVASGDVAREDDVLLGLAPYCHAAGPHAVLNAGIFAGATVVTMRRCDTVRLARSIDTHRVSSMLLAPPAIDALARSPVVGEYDLSSVRAILCAAPLSAETGQAAGHRLNCVVRQAYGLTEMTPVASSARSPSSRHGSVGQLVPSTECKIVDLESGQELDPGEAGEVLVRGPQAMTGYLNQPDETSAALTQDGWLRTSDVGYADQDGYLYIVDRVTVGADSTRTSTSVACLAG